MTIHNLEPAIGPEELFHTFVSFGDVKDIRDVPGRPSSRVIEFYNGALPFLLSEDEPAPWLPAHCTLGSNSPKYEKTGCTYMAQFGKEGSGCSPGNPWMDVAQAWV